MRRYIGCDVHARSCTFGIKDERGRRIGRDVVERNGRALVDYVRRLPGERHMCLEEGEQSQWIVELLSGHVERIEVVVPPERKGNKNRGTAGKRFEGEHPCSLWSPPRDTGRESCS